jgi:hypothetical protein
MSVKHGSLRYDWFDPPAPQDAHVMDWRLRCYYYQVQWIRPIAHVHDFFHHRKTGQDSQTLRAIETDRAYGRQFAVDDSIAEAAREWAEGMRSVVVLA